ncbi:MAG: hypothetical protein RL732_167, partial [Bacteroidota bacterium]
YVPSVEAYVKGGGKLDTVQQIDIQELKALQQQPEVQIVDLRGLTEFKSGHIKGANHIFVGTLPEHLNEISRNKKVVLHCQGGDRSSLGYSLLAKAGYRNILNYDPGMNEWVNLGEPVES